MSSITLNARKQWSNFYISFTVKQRFFSWWNRKTLLNIPDLENIYTFHHWKYYRKKNSEFYFPRNDRQINSSQFSYWEYLENQTQLNEKKQMNPENFMGELWGHAPKEEGIAKRWTWHLSPLFLLCLFLFLPILQHEPISTDSLTQEN